MDITLACYVLFLVVLISFISVLLFKLRDRVWSYVLLATVYSMSFLWVSFNFGRDIFDAMNMVCIALFFGGFFLLVYSACLTWARFKLLTVFFGGLAFALLVVAVDAYLIEPNWLEITRMKIFSEKVPASTKIAIVSDIQTDSVGAFESELVKEVMKEKPDMIIFPGDFIQAFPKDKNKQLAKLNQLLKANNLSAPLGIYATEGDTESFYWSGNSWVNAFSDLPVFCFKESSTISNDRFAITGLTLKDSSHLSYEAPDTDLYHIWIGHRPGFSLDDPEADLMIAGHTHGGQVQIPYLGPVFTFSRVPRLWGAGGLIKFDSGKHLIISRGIGMERGYAPRIRFFCRPQLIFLDLVPLKKADK